MLFHVPRQKVTKHRLVYGCLLNKDSMGPVRCFQIWILGSLWVAPAVTGAALPPLMAATSHSLKSLLRTDLSLILHLLHGGRQANHLHLPHHHHHLHHYHHHYRHHHHHPQPHQRYLNVETAPYPSPYLLSPIHYQERWWKCSVTMVSKVGSIDAFRVNNKKYK